MPWISQMLGFALLFFGIALALWVGIWILLAIFAIGIVLVVWAHVKDFLLKKGILNPTPGVPNGIIVEHEEQPNITLIEGDYTRVDSE